MADVITNVTNALEQLGTMELSGIKLEEAKPELLDLTQGSLDVHVVIQPAAMAYYTGLKKMAKRRLDNLMSAYDRWEKKGYALARAAVESGCTSKSSIKVEDVKARFITDNEPDIEKWEKRVDQARAQYDDLDAWLEAWKQKSFSMREIVELEEDERMAGGSSIVKSETPTGQFKGTATARVRELLRKTETSQG